MKVKENMWGKRGRPRKFHAGETIEWRLRAPDNLLMELRICGRLGRKSINDEIISRLLISLNYKPDHAVIRTAQGERLVALAVKFEQWLDELIKTDDKPAERENNASAHEEVWMWRNGERVLIPGKTSGYSMRIPENLADEIRIMARIHKRSLNDEMLTRLMNSLGYFTDRLLEQNEDAQALKVLCMAFEWYLKEKIAEAEDRGAAEEKQE